MLLNIMNPTPSVLKLLTHIHPVVVLLDHAISHLVSMTLSKLPDIPIVQESLLLLVPSNKDQFQLPSMPKIGHLIPPESTPTVEPPSITESYLPDIPPPIG